VVWPGRWQRGPARAVSEWSGMGVGGVFRPRQCRQRSTRAMLQIFQWGGDGADLPVGVAMERNFQISSTSTNRDLGVFCFLEGKNWKL
jgi:hypothetical protein